MKKLQTVILLLVFAGPVFSTGPDVDFDQKNKATKDIKTFVGENTSVPCPGPVNTTDFGIEARREILTETGFPNPLPSEVPPKGNLEFKLFRVTKSGQEIEILPSIDPETGKKGYYKLKPNEQIKSEGRCSCPSCPSNYTWKSCQYYTFYPQNGGHEHNANVPPYTTWGGKEYPSPMCTPVTPVNEYGSIYFTTPEFATRAEHKIQYSGTCNDTFFNTIDIKIDNLALLPPASEDGLHGGDTYYLLIGKTPEHVIHHFGRPSTITSLRQIAWQYHVEFPNAPVLCINDISLRWGGKFDVNGQWTGGDHKYHRYGKQADVRINTIPPANRSRFKEICCQYGVQPKEEGKWEDPNMENLDLSYISCGTPDKSTGPHYHLNFENSADPVENPPDDPTHTCP